MNGAIVYQIHVCIAESTRKILLPGAIPTLNLPQKSFETQSKPRRKTERTETTKELATTSRATASRVYKHLADFKRKVTAVKLSGWSRKEREHGF